MRKILAALALLALLGAIGYAWHLYQQAETLGQRVATVEQTTEELAQSVDVVRKQADQSQDAIEAAEALGRQAQEDAAAETHRAEQAAQERASAEGARQRALETLGESQADAEQASARAEQQRRERREEWQRLGSALRKIAPTETDDWKYQVQLTGLRKSSDGAFDGKSRETLSRLAGALLANYGYAAHLSGTGAPAIREYLLSAGVAADSISVDQPNGDNRLRVEETVLSHP